MTTERGTTIDSDGLYTYIQRFDDLSGALSVTTTFPNNSGAYWMYITVIAICMNESRNFKLRIFDSDLGEFIDVTNEDGIGEKERRFEVEPHRDTDELIWTSTVTDMSMEVVYARISLYYLYDEEADFRVPGWLDPTGNFTLEDIRREKFYTNLSWVLLSSLMIGGTGLFIIQTQGTGVKTFFKEKFKKGAK